MSFEDRSPMLRARGLGKVYRIYDKPYQRLLQGLTRRPLHREFWALRDVDFDLAPGETLGVLGTNGAGKSTLLQILSGVLAQTTGSVDVRGKVAALLELGAGFNPEFSGRENAKLNAAIMGLSPRQIEERLDAMVEFAELGEFIDQPVKTYSSGMYVRLAFSVAIHVDPAVLIIDEALAVGDARFQAKCMDRIRAMKHRGVSILFVSHDVGAVRQLCDRALWLDQGRTRMQGDVFAVTSRYIEFLFDQEDPAPPLQEAGDGGTSQARMAATAHVRWGSRVGSIRDAGLYGSDGRPRDVFHDDEPIEVRIRFRLPDGADPATTGPAFSFKDTRGSDLVVATTLDRDVPVPATGGEMEARFVLDNCLVPGNYLVVVALEDRSDGTIRYFDYIEGGLVFASVQSRHLHGRFLPKMQVAVQACGPAVGT